MGIRILAINASPRAGSNSGALLEASLATANARLDGDIDAEIVALRECDIRPCLACGVCGKTKDDGRFIPCVQRDDTDALLGKMTAADGIAIATPVYFGLASDLFTKFVMRTRVLRHQDFRLANKPLGIMAVAGRRSGGAETAIVSGWLPFIRHGCLIVGNGDATCQFGAMGWAGPAGHILSDDWGLEQGEQTIRRIYEVAALVKAGRAALGGESPMRFSYTSGGRT